ncbi:uncharacterized protein LOC106651674 isoform X1 [Trichogramma pretiosum]|uniref:uncharacterized protein LOC106651674 isoform X1 n=1 Tax=Trichogramma pretiosum TaxID=7493 RepID=UPI0006C9DC1C|nr:uncharacterized protein LOC106651674 isoform X1 [Trichogramma pretiosum]
MSDDSEESSNEEYWDNLDKRADVPLNKYSKSSIKLLISSLKRLLKLANESYKKNSMEDAYVYYKKWMKLLNYIKTKEKLDKHTVAQFCPTEDIEEAIKIFKAVKMKLKDKLKADEKLRKKERQRKPNPQLNTIVNHDENLGEKLIQNKLIEMECTELFKKLESSKDKVLIIDLRKDDEYNLVKIKNSNVIHLPEKSIKAEKKVNEYISDLNKEAELRFRAIFLTTTIIELIVLMDTSSDTIKANTPLSWFRNTLGSCEETRQQIAILKGGFAEWVDTFPHMVIRSSFPSNNTSQDSDWDNIDFLPNGTLIKQNKSTDSQKTSINSNTIFTNSHTFQPSPVLHNDSMGIKAKNYPEFSAQADVSSNFQPSPVLIKDSIGIKAKNYSEFSAHNEKNNQKNKSHDTPYYDRSLKPKATFKIEKEIDKLQINKSWDREQHVVENKLSENKGHTQVYIEKKIYPTLDFGSKVPKSQVVKSDNRKINKENIQYPSKPIEPALLSGHKKLPQKMDIDEQTETIHREPLKSENSKPVNPGLKRSHSSPNLQVKRLKTSNHKLQDKPIIDRGSKPTVTNIPKINQLDREARFEPVYGAQRHPGITGLKNLGNSCYMNSIVQCLSNTELLAEYFIKNCYMNDLNRNSNINNNNNKTSCSAYVAEEVAQVIKALWRGRYKSISPRDLKVVVGQYKLQFESYDQQDSHEFLMFLLDWMHNDLKADQVTPSIHEIQSVAQKEWEKSMMGKSSIISELFFGQLKSTITCMTCEQKSSTYETFNSLTMSLPGTNKCGLDDCVKKFLSGQKVSEWNCPNCKVPRDGIKKFDFARLPAIVVIHLNRFGETGGWLEKKNTTVDFPLHNFNLRPYLDGNETHGKRFANYNLYAMSNHYGTMDGGHYTAYCKHGHQNKWYKYDDHTVMEVPASDVKNQSNSAYLLFYSAVSSNNYLNS